MLSSCKFGSVQTGSYPVCLYAPSPELRTRTVQSSGWTKLEPELNHQFSSELNFGNPSLNSCGGSEGMHCGFIGAQSKLRVAD